MLALSVCQPSAALISRGVKTVEFRSRPTRGGGERFHLYAAKGGWAAGKKSTLAAVGLREVSAAQPPAWMRELADLLILGDLPRGVILRHAQDRQRGDRAGDAVRRGGRAGVRGAVAVALGGRGAG